MTTKRTFLKSLMGIVAIVALAPELAFGRLKMPAVENPWKEWLPEPWQQAIIDYIESHPRGIVIWSRQAGKLTPWSSFSK